MRRAHTCCDIGPGPIAATFSKGFVPSFTTRGVGLVSLNPSPNCEHFASDSIVSSREARGSAGECGVERARSGGARDGCRWRYGEFAGGGRAVGPRQQRS